MAIARAETQKREHTHENLVVKAIKFILEGGECPVKVEKTVEEACKLAEAGFDYFTTMHGIQIFRKRK